MHSVDTGVTDECLKYPAYFVQMTSNVIVISFKDNLSFQCISMLK